MAVPRIWTVKVGPMVDWKPTGAIPKSKQMPAAYSPVRVGMAFKENEQLLLVGRLEAST